MLISAVSVMAQNKDSQLTTFKLNREYFYIDPLVFYPLDSAIGRLDLYVEIPLENLSFKQLNNGENYEASIALSVQIKNSLNELIITQTYDDKITNTKSEQKKMSDKSVSSMKSYFLKPDFYKLIFIIKDKSTSNEFTKEVSFTVKDPLIERLISSSIMLLSNYEQDSKGEKEITPIINSNVGTIETFYVFTEFWNRGESDISNKMINIKISDEKNKNIFDTLVSINLKIGMNSIIQKLYTEKYTIGDLKMEIFDGDIKVTERSFTNKWADVPVSIKDLDNAINQLLYIATSDELDHIKDAKTNEDKLKRFMKFWKSKDPSPRTAKNELMIEYYNRIKIANERYSHYVEGWKTDMGMVFIIYGNPSVIDRHPFDSDSRPYEVWTYYEINRQYIFVDYTGFGDYRLTTPIWDDRTKIRF